MREILFRGKLAINNEWRHSRSHDGTLHSGVVQYDFIPETVGQFSGVYDTECEPIYEGDIVRFFRYVGKIVFEYGCFAIAITENIDWDYIAEEMEEYAGLGYLTACHCDNLIALWEIMWNFNCDEDTCNVVEVIGNIHDNPELLEG